MKAVGSRSFKPRRTRTLLHRFEQELGESKSANKIKQWIKQTYQSAPTLAEATLRLVHELFADYGLVILDADKPV